jgi:hypothetical protein
VAQAVSRRVLAAEAGSAPRSVRVTSVMDKVTLGLFFSEFIGDSLSVPLYQAPHTHISPGGQTTGPLVAAVQRRSVKPST